MPVEIVKTSFAISLLLNIIIIITYNNDNRGMRTRKQIARDSTEPSTILCVLIGFLSCHNYFNTSKGQRVFKILFLLYRAIPPSILFPYFCFIRESSFFGANRRQMATKRTTTPKNEKKKRVLTQQQKNYIC